MTLHRKSAYMSMTATETDVGNGPSWADHLLRIATDFKWSRFDFQSVIAVVSNGHQRNEAVALFPRLVEQRVADAMSDTRVVLIMAPRQSGKTTLAKKAANEGIDASVHVLT